MAAPPATTAATAASAPVVVSASSMAASGVHPGAAAAGVPLAGLPERVPTVVHASHVPATIAPAPASIAAAAGAPPPSVSVHHLAPPAPRGPMTASGVAPHAVPHPAPAGAALHIPDPPNVRKASAPLPRPPPAKKRRGRGGAASKGLRHFSMKVCQKVESKGKTTYNEVADELVKEFALLKTPEMKGTTYDEKNIRRRVYDALNVLMAMDIITKDRKEISWRGLPSNSKDELEALRHAHTMTTRTVEKKKEHLRELLLQQIAFKKLLARNQARIASTPPESRIHLPFIVISTSDQTTIQLEMDTPERRDLFFNFSAPFEIHDDHEILMRMNLHKCDPSELPQLVPPEMIQYLPPDMRAAPTEDHTNGVLALGPGHDETAAPSTQPLLRAGPAMTASPAPPSSPFAVPPLPTATAVAPMASSAQPVPTFAAATAAGVPPAAAAGGAPANAVPASSAAGGPHAVYTQHAAAHAVPGSAPHMAQAASSPALATPVPQASAGMSGVGAGVATSTVATVAPQALSLSSANHGTPQPAPSAPL